MGLRSTYDKKFIFSDEAHFVLGRYVNKQNYRIWGHRKPARIHWKVDAPRTNLVQRHNWPVFSSKMSKERLLQSMVIVIGPCWTNFCSQKLKRRILVTFGFTAEATLDVLRTVFEDRIISRRADVIYPPRSCDLTPLDYYLWGPFKDKWHPSTSQKRLKH